MRPDGSWLGNVGGGDPYHRPLGLKPGHQSDEIGSARRFFRPNYIQKVRCNMLAKRTFNIYHTQAALLKAMANPIRLQILRLLGDDGTYVCHLALALRRRQPYISQQLSVLRRAGLVTDERQGLNILYRLNDRRVREFLDSLVLLMPGQPEATAPLLSSEPLAGCLCPHCARSFGLTAAQVCCLPEPILSNGPPQQVSLVREST
jgi:ArsR family transcriptional regulator